MFILETKSLNIGYPRKEKTEIIQSDLNLTMQAGELVCLIGPNGCGKSTLIRTLSGLQPPVSGKTYIQEKQIEKLTYAEKAKLLSVVLTDRIDIENATVHSIVSLGRHPHSDWWGKLTDEDESLIHQAIELVHLTAKTHQYFDELSDGEKQRTMIAKAFVQNTPLILLDEPTAHLDLPNRVEIMLLLHSLAHKTNTTILMSTHELDMALQAADQIWLMTTEHGIQKGVPEDLVLNGSFDKAFYNKNYVFNPSNGNFSMNYPMKRQISVSGDKTRMYWTLRALARAGYEVVMQAEHHVEITEDAWLYENKRLNSVEELLLQIQSQHI